MVKIYKNLILFFLVLFFSECKEYGKIEKKPAENFSINKALNSEWIEQNRVQNETKSMIAKQLFNFAHSYYALKDYQKAKIFTLKGIKQFPHGDLYFLLGQILKIENNLEIAVQSFLTSINLDSKKRLSGLLNISCIYQELQDLPKAKDALTEAYTLGFKDKELDCKNDSHFFWADIPNKFIVQVGTLFVSTNSLVIRSSESLSGKRLGLLPHGTFLTNTKTGKSEKVGNLSGNWISADQITGFVFSGFLSQDEPFTNDKLKLEKDSNYTESVCEEGCGVFRRESLLELSNGKAIYREYNGESSGFLFIGTGTYSISNNRLNIRLDKYADIPASDFYEDMGNEIQYSYAPFSYTFELDYEDKDGKSYFTSQSWIHFGVKKNGSWGYELKDEKTTFIVSKN
ncbi:MAG: hypothetical protein KDC90_12760 [Ignavibacteriae bacterium]|nr:hypothetical protein [Ignavibacteriota bacterium]